MPAIPVTTWYLEMLHAPQGDAPILPPHVRILEDGHKDADFYLFLYTGVGADYAWVNRTLLPREELETILQNPHTHIYVLHDGGEIAGYAELDTASLPDVELVYFGLMPEARGRGLGKLFLNWVSHQAFSLGARRFWVHTCELDHPAALPAYEKAGFVQYDVQTVQQELPEGHPLLSGGHGVH